MTGSLRGAAVFQDVVQRRGWSGEDLPAELALLPTSELDTALRWALALAGRESDGDLKTWHDRLYTEGRRRLFSHRFAAPPDEVTEVAGYFFPLASVVLQEQVRVGGSGIARRMPFVPLEDHEIDRWPSGPEYRRLLQLVEDEGVLVTQAMGQEWLGFSINDHILGVTGLVLWLGRQLSRRIPVDLPLLHGAAIGHDIGKFGCLGEEERRIPRLHYYYTHMWYHARGLTSIGHIATNHSCWDLEQIRMPVETELLIYADFRVKDGVGPDGRRRMEISTLREAFTTILSKLENVDAAKERRYRGVYRKLRDLEDYMLPLQVRLDPPGFELPPVAKPKLPKELDVVAVMGGQQRPETVALAVGAEIATVSRLFSTAHNIGVMERLRDLPALRALLEEARSSEGWRDLRTYLGVLGEYAPALSMEQKELALDFFFELLSHRDDDIRYHAANQIGDVLALGEDFWRKDLPAGVVIEGGNWVLEQLDRVLKLLDLASIEPEEDMGPTEKLIYAIPIALRRLVRNAEPDLQTKALSLVFERLSARIGDRRPLVGLYVCESIEILLPHWSIEQKLALVEVAQFWSHAEEVNTRLMSWRALAGLAADAGAHPELLPGLRYCVELIGRRLSARSLVAELHLVEELGRLCGLDRVQERCQAWLGGERNAVREVMLRGLKARVGWVEKKVNCDFLVMTTLARVAEQQDPESHFANEVAFHLANLLKVSRVEGTRFHAGRSLLRLLPVLDVTQRNDLMVELIRSLQLDVEAITRYIPRFLGPIIASLPDQELNEAIEDIEGNARRGSEPLQRLLLQTVGWVVLTLDVARLRQGALRRLVGVLLGALAETRDSTAHEAFAQVAMVVGRLVRKDLNDGRLSMLLELATKKLLTLVSHKAGDRGRFFLVASALNWLERALRIARPQVRFPSSPSVAVIPGTFDPFTNAHSEIVARVLSHADEVLLQIDDYSWSKHAQPRQVRKELAWMALAQEPAVYLAPFEPPINIASPRSLEGLKRKIGRRVVKLVVGSDVLEGASAYRDVESPIWDIPHLLVMREGAGSRKWQEKLTTFRGGVQVARISAASRLVSSTSLRAALDRRGDLDQHCDPLVGRTLRERQLYVNYPSKKEPVGTPEFWLAVEAGQRRIPPTLRQIVRIDSITPVAGWTQRHKELCTLQRWGGSEPEAALSWWEMAAVSLPVVLGDQQLAPLPGGSLVGLGALVNAIGVGGSDDGRLLDRLMARVTSRWLNAGLLFGLVGVPEQGGEKLWAILHEYGFAWLTGSDAPAREGVRWAATHLSEPLVLVWDLEGIIQPHYVQAPQIKQVIGEGRSALARFFADSTPGAALFQVSEHAMKQKISEWTRERIAAERNGRRWVVLGLGRQFSRDIVASSPTISLDLERFLTWEGYEAGLGASHGSPSLELQLVTARELGQDALLLVPFLDNPEPIVQVAAAARDAGLKIREVLVGVTSAAAHATLHLAGIPHRCGVIVPRWRGVLRESALQPYLGGWSIRGRAPLDLGSLLPSLNDLLPYHHPHPLGLDGKAALDFSRLMLDQTRRLLEKLEEIFRHEEGRLLGLRDLPIVVRTPRCPPFPEGFVPARDRVPSGMLREDLEALARLHPESHEAHRTRWRDR